MVYHQGKSQANKYLIMYALQNAGTRNRLGISVSKKVGNSVVRHHLTRLVRESYRLNEEQFQSGYDLVVIVRPSAKEKGYHEIESALLHLGGKIRYQMKQLLILLIRFYQKYLSPMKTTRCPYVPTCSQYGLEAIQKHGAIKGSILAAWRILRCNPFSHGGIDPVPDEFLSFRRKKI